MGRSAEPGHGGVRTAVPLEGNPGSALLHFPPALHDPAGGGTGAREHRKRHALGAGCGLSGGCLWDPPGSGTA